MTEETQFQLKVKVSRYQGQNMRRRTWRVLQLIATITTQRQTTRLLPQLFAFSPTLSSTVLESLLTYLDFQIFEKKR